MSVEQTVAGHYTQGTLEQRILATLRAAGKNPDALHSSDISAVDEFHVGGLQATEDLAVQLHLRPGLHLLDVGCGIGGPARYFAEQGCHVNGVDLTEEFVRVAQMLTRLTRLEDRAQFQQGSGLALPFEPASFDAAYMIHVGMNIQDKAGVFREVARVLKPGARFAIFDIMRAKDGLFEFPVPWAVSPENSYVATLNEYRAGLENAGFRIEQRRSRAEFAIEFTKNAMQRAASAAAHSGPPALGLQLLMGERTPIMIKNVLVAMESGILDPVELVAVRA